METDIETVIVGGGQAGLAVSYFLKDAGCEHVVLEKAPQAGHAWRDDRWDSFTLVTPNWSFRLPGAEYSGDSPDGFMPRDELVRHFEEYIQINQLPVEFGVRVDEVEADDGGYRVESSRGRLWAKQVVIATGLFQKPAIPPWAREVPETIFHIHSGKYRNPSALPPGAVLVVGSGQSGCQIAEELLQSGREVYLSTGRAGRAPRRFRGKDIYEWASLIGLLDRTPAQLRSSQERFASNPLVSGKDGGHTLNLHRFARDGMRLLGRAQGALDGRVFFAPDLAENLAFSDQFEKNLIQRIDGYIRFAGLEAPAETVPELKDGYEMPEMSELDLKSAGVTTLIWAMGYDFDFNLVKLPVVDETGFPLSQNGETSSRGLYFSGMPWLPGQKSGLLLGVGEQAHFVARKIIGR